MSRCDPFFFARKLFCPAQASNQRPVHREVLVRQQLLRPRLRDHLLEKRFGDFSFQQPLPVLGEHRHVPHLVVHAQPHEPPEQQVVVQLLHQQPLAAHPVEHLQQQCPQQLFRLLSMAVRSASTSPQTAGTSPSTPCPPSPAAYVTDDRRALASPGKCSCTCFLAVRRVCACLLRRSHLTLRCKVRHFFRSLLGLASHPTQGKGNTPPAGACASSPLSTMVLRRVRRSTERRSSCSS